MTPMTSLDHYDGTEFDALVIGGGPAGAAYATLMAQQGFSVLVVEGKRFPRDHIGESLLAESMPILAQLGVMPALERRGYPLKRGAVFVWGRDRAEIKLDMPNPGYAYQVNRADFDDLLLRNAIDAGVTVWEGHWVKEPLWRDGRMRGAIVATAGHAGNARAVHARFVVDASGLFQFLPRKLGLEVELFGPRRVAVTSYVTGAVPHSDMYGDDIISEASRDGWLWFIPLRDGVTSVGFVGDEADITASPEQALAVQVESAPLIRRLLERSTQIRRPRLLKYTNHCVRSLLWRDGYILVGDTAIFVDPLFSTGVRGALYSASNAAAASASVIDGDLAEDEAARWYTDTFTSHYAHVRSMIELLYGIHPGESRFWRDRNLFDVDGATAEALVSQIGAAGMDFFSRTSASGSLPLPPEVTKRLPSFHTRLRPISVPLDRVVELAPGVRFDRDLEADAGRVRPSILLHHPQGRTHELQFREGSPVDQLLRALDGVRPLVDVFDDLTSTGSAEKLQLLVGALVDGGFLSVVPPALGRVSAKGAA